SGSMHAGWSPQTRTPHRSSRGWRNRSPESIPKENPRFRHFPFPINYRNSAIILYISIRYIPHNNFLSVSILIDDWTHKRHFGWNSSYRSPSQQENFNEETCHRQPNGRGAYRSCAGNCTRKSGRPAQDGAPDSRWAEQSDTLSTARATLLVENRARALKRASHGHDQGVQRDGAERA